MDRVRRLGRRDDPLGARELHRRGEDVGLAVGLGADEPVEDELRDQRRHAVVAEAAGVDARAGRSRGRACASGRGASAGSCRRSRRRRGRGSASGRRPARRRARRCRARRSSRAGTGTRARRSWSRRRRSRRRGPGRRPAMLHLRERLLADHRLVHEHVVEDAAERVRGVLALAPRPRPPPRWRCRGCPGESGSSARIARPRVRVLGRARDDARAPGLHHRAAVRLLLVRDLDHVDLALEPEELRGERDARCPTGRRPSRWRSASGPTP